jgi:large subunit ribosomal protein L30
MVHVIKIRLAKSSIGAPGKLKAVLRGLGLRRINQIVEKPDNEAIRGMVDKVPHLVEVMK